MRKLALGLWKGAASSRAAILSKDLQHGWKPCPFKTSTPHEFFRSLLKLRDFGEIKFPHFHRWYHHIERLLAAGAHRSSHGFHMGEHMNQALVETEVAHALADFAVFYKERAVARHAGQNLFVRIDLADIPQPGDQNAALGRGNHL